jgi:hypothetical protein
MDRLLETMPKQLPLLLGELIEAWPFLSKKEKIEGVGLLSRSQAEEFLKRLDAAEQADVVISLHRAGAHLWSAF